MLSIEESGFSEIPRINRGPLGSNVRLESHSFVFFGVEVDGPGFPMNRNAINW